MGTTSAADTLRATGRLDRRAAGARLAELFAGHGAAVLGICRMLLRHREEAEDALQQTFLSAYRSLLNGVEPLHPAAWLATIARNECWARIQQRAVEPLGDREPPSTVPDPLSSAMAAADLEELWHAIGELPRRQRQALLLREFSGLSYLELAEELGVSTPTVESLLFRARRALRRVRPASAPVSGLASLGAIRDALARAIGGMPDPTAAAGPLAKIAGLPLAAKLAAGAAAVVVAGGTVATVERDAVTRVTQPSAQAASLPAPARAAPRSVDPLPVSVAVVSRKQPALHRPSPARVALAPRPAPVAVAPRPQPRPAPPAPAAGALAPPPAAPVAPLPDAAPAEPAADPSSSASADDAAEPADDEGSASASETGDDSSGPGSGDARDNSGPDDPDGTSSDDSSSGPGSGHDSDGSEGSDGSGGDGGDD